MVHLIVVYIIYRFVVKVIYARLCSTVSASFDESVTLQGKLQAESTAADVFPSQSISMKLLQVLSADLLVTNIF